MCACFVQNRTRGHFGDVERTEKLTAGSLACCLSVSIQQVLTWTINTHTDARAHTLLETINQFVCAPVGRPLNWTVYMTLSAVVHIYNFILVTRGMENCCTDNLSSLCEWIITKAVLKVVIEGSKF